MLRTVETRLHNLLPFQLLHGSRILPLPAKVLKSAERPSTVPHSKGIRRHQPILSHLPRIGFPCSMLIIMTQRVATASELGYRLQTIRPSRLPTRIDSVDPSGQGKPAIPVPTLGHRAVVTPL